MLPTKLLLGRLYKDPLQLSFDAKATIVIKMRKALVQVSMVWE
jgi:hypothetical protein